MTIHKDYEPITWDGATAAACRQLWQLAMAEDLGGGLDWTTTALIAETDQGSAAVVARQAGVVAGMRSIPLLLETIPADVRWDAHVDDGAVVGAGHIVGELSGSARDLLQLERSLLNLLGRLCGIASLTRRYVEAVQGTGARVYDTRKTTPGWRRLEKFAVGCGGGCNHRLGLYDGVLIKDNHLAIGQQRVSGPVIDPAQAVVQARAFVNAHLSPHEAARILIEIELDDLAPLKSTLAAGPDIVLLDNMSCEQLRTAVAVRDRVARHVQLEASGGVSLSTVRQIADTGVDRISVGALTHSAVSLDLALDWSYSRST